MAPITVLKPVLLLALFVAAAVIPGVPAKSIKHLQDSGVEGKHVLEIIVDGEVSDEHVVSVQKNAGERLTLICIAQGYNPPSLSWWEGETELLEAQISRSTYATSSVLQLEKLRGMGSARSLTCRSSGQELPRTVELQIAEPVEILVNGEPIPEGGTVMQSVPVIAGQDVNLNCIVQGYHLPTLSWWEGETELLEAKVSTSTYATSSVLQLKEFVVSGSARSFTCRSSGQELPMTVQLHIAASSTWAPWILVACVSAVVTVAFFGLLVSRLHPSNSSKGQKIVHKIETHSQKLIRTLKPYKPLSKSDQNVVAPVHHTAKIEDSARIV